jgi:hypothetical protein
MADRKISDLTALTTPASGDFLPIVDISEAAAASKNKRITIEELFRGVPLGTAAAPSIAIEGDEDTGVFSPGANQLAISTNGTGRLFVSSNPHVGIGVSPNASSASSQVLEVGPSTFSSIGNDSYQGSNWFYTGAAYVYKNSAAATQYVQGSGNHIWLTAAAGTAGNAVTFSEKMRITDAGLVGLGTSTPQTLCHIIDTNPLVVGDSSGSLAVTYETGTTAVGQGGGIFLGIPASAGSFFSTYIKAARESATSTNSAAALVFGTRVNSGSNTERVRITAAGLVGIGTTSPSTTLHLDGTVSNGPKLRVSRGAGNTNYLELGTSGGTSTITANGVTGVNGDIAFLRDANTGTPTESVRIDSSGRLLVGTSTARTNLRSGAATIKTQFDTTNSNDAFVLIQNTIESNPAYLILAKQKSGSAGGNTSVADADGIGTIEFHANDGTNFLRSASISCSVDGTPGTDDMPSRLVFSTTSDGAASVTERLRITSAGVLQIANAGNIAVGTTTGTKIGTATTQKLGFYNATPVVQPAAVADATTAVDVITQLNDLLAKLRTLGIIAT